jgi:hypothetical protein
MASRVADIQDRGRASFLLPRLRSMSFVSHSMSQPNLT